MPGVHIVTDSACDLTDQLVKEHNVVVVPLTIRFGQEEFEDRRQLTPAEFWERCRGKGALPETGGTLPRRVPGRLPTGGRRGRRRRAVRDHLLEKAVGDVLVRRGSGGHVQRRSRAGRGQLLVDHGSGPLGDRGGRGGRSRGGARRARQRDT